MVFARTLSVLAFALLTEPPEILGSAALQLQSGIATQAMTPVDLDLEPLALSANLDDALLADASMQLADESDLRLALRGLTDISPATLHLDGTVTPPRDGDKTGERKDMSLPHDVSRKPAAKRKRPEKILTKKARHQHPVCALQAGAVPPRTPRGRAGTGSAARSRRHLHTRQNRARSSRASANKAVQKAGLADAIPALRARLVDRAVQLEAEDPETQAFLSRLLREHLAGLVSMSQDPSASLAQAAIEDELEAYNYARSVRLLLERHRQPLLSQDPSASLAQAAIEDDLEAYNYARSARLLLERHRQPLTGGLPTQAQLAFLAQPGCYGDGPTSGDHDRAAVCGAAACSAAASSGSTAAGSSCSSACPVASPAAGGLRGSLVAVKTFAPGGPTGKVEPVSASTSSVTAVSGSSVVSLPPHMQTRPTSAK